MGVVQRGSLVSKLRADSRTVRTWVCMGVVPHRTLETKGSLWGRGSLSRTETGSVRGCAMLRIVPLFALLPFIDANFPDPSFRSRRRFFAYTDLSGDISL